MTKEQAPGRSKPEEEPPGVAAPRRLWGGRFGGAPAATLDDLNRSLPLDVRLWREDIEASRAWAAALAAADVVSAEEARRLDVGLAAVAERIASGAADGALDEDIHSLVERLLYDEIGDLAGKLHTGRSRNDQVATDTRLWALRRGAALADEVAGVQRALLAQAEATLDLLMPAYTHVRRAQPVRVAHWAMAHLWALDRDRERLRQALERVAVLPLGSGAIAGSGFPVDRELLKRRLGFLTISPNSMDAVGDRDWVAELVFAGSLLAVHLSRLAEDLILFSSDEFGFVRLPEAYTTGSSLMPQKRNPDGLELARGKAARMCGDVAAILALLKGLPTGYQKDLQEDKALLFRSFDDLMVLLPAMRETVTGLEWRADALAAAAADASLLATDLADELARRGVPFREAHGIVGRLVREAERRGVTLAELGPDDLGGAHPTLGADPPPLSAAASVEARGVPGGTARAAVEAQLAEARRRLR